MKTVPTLSNASFWLAAFIVAVPALYAIRDSASGGLSWTFATFELAPVMLACAFYVFKWRMFAMGWLVTTGVFGYVVLLGVVISGRSTAVLDFIWLPMWSVCVVGPIGGAFGVAIQRRRSAG